MITPLYWAAMICVHCPKVGSGLSSAEQNSDKPEQRQHSLAEGIKGVHEGAEATGLVQPAEGKGEES